MHATYQMMYSVNGTLLVMPDGGYWRYWMDKTDGPVHEAREKALSGDRIPEWRKEPRPFFCRGCTVQVMDVQVPRGWYMLTRATGPGENSHRLGLYHTFDCMLNEAPRLRGIEGALGNNWDTAPSPFQDRR